MTKAEKDNLKGRGMWTRLRGSKSFWLAVSAVATAVCLGMAGELAWSDVAWRAVEAAGLIFVRDGVAKSKE